MSDIVYIKLSKSLICENRKIRLKDITQVVCDDPDVKYGIESIELGTCALEKAQKVIDILEIIDEVRKRYPEVVLMNQGETDTIVYYKPFDKSENIKQAIKLIFVCLVAFLGAAFTIFSYNSDVNMTGQLELMQSLFVGDSKKGAICSSIFYCAGLFVGIIVFFNHGAKKKFTEDPTPLQVQMRAYEEQVNDTIIKDEERRKGIKSAD